jgi:hypothetical protein
MIQDNIAIRMEIILEDWNVIIDSKKKEEIISKIGRNHFFTVLDVFGQYIQQSKLYFDFLVLLILNKHKKYRNEIDEEMHSY